MSKIGKKLIPLPESNLINLNIHNKLSIVSALGHKSINIPKELKLDINPTFIRIHPKSVNTKSVKSLWGLYNRQIFNDIKGINNLHMRKLELRGVGFKGEIQIQENQQILLLNIGFSHPIPVKIPQSILILPTLNKFRQLTNFILLGEDKQKLHEFIQYVISLKKRDKYKGKGIFIEGEKITLKEGKRQSS